jgi:site-specific recombinase XerC
MHTNWTATSAHGFFEWCIGEGLITLNPAAGINKNPEQPRDRGLPTTGPGQVLNAVP